MSNELTGVVIGGAIGIVATLLGTVVTLWLARAEEQRKAKEATTNALRSCQYEAVTVASTLHTVGPTKVPELVAIEQAIYSGYLNAVPQETARQLLLFRTLVHDLNGTMTLLENLSCAAIGAGEGRSESPAVAAYFARARTTAATTGEQAHVLVELLRKETG